MEQARQQARRNHDAFLQIPFVLAGCVILFNILISVLALKHQFAMSDGMLATCVFANVGIICAVSLLGLAAVTHWGIKNNLRQERDLALSREEWISRTWIGYAFSFLFGILVSTGVSALSNPLIGLFFFLQFILIGQTVKNTKETCLYMITIGLATIAVIVSSFIMFSQAYDSACRATGSGRPSFCEVATSHHDPAHDSGSTEKANPNASVSK